MVIGQGFRLVLVGLSTGVVAAWVLTRLLSSFSPLLYGVGASDPPTIIAVSLVLAVVTIVACYIPALRAVRVDPRFTLRFESSDLHLSPSPQNLFLECGSSCAYPPFRFG